MIKVVIIEDSALYQMYLKNTVASDAYIELCGCAGTGKEALALIDKERPDVVSMDLNLPDVKGFELLETIVSTYGIPVIVVTSDGSSSQMAMQWGAVDFMEKVDGSTGMNMEQFALLWRMKVKMQGTAKKKILPSLKTVSLDKDWQDLIVIGASLGGTEAILEVLKNLPEDMPGIVVVQHMPAGFTNAYATRLDRICQMRVVEATDHMAVERGKVIIAKGGEQLTVHKGVKGYYVRSKPDEKVSGFCPSVDVLFSSTASAAREYSVGVILTGIGSDGAKGMLLMHQNGAYTIGQNEETCVVYGMPKKAKENNAVDRELPLDQISGALIRHFEN